MKRLLSLLAVLVIGLTACSSDEPVNYSGSYEETDDEGIVTITEVTYTMEGDDITAVEFNAEKDGADKRDEEAYPMNVDGEGAGTWGTQADALADYIVENDAFPEVDSEGYAADADTGATIHITGFEAAWNAAEAE